MRIFVVGAHLDDVELAAGGTLAKAVKNGHEVKVLIMSKSGYTNIKGETQRSDDVAVKEGIIALNTLGIYDIETFDELTDENIERLVLKR